MVTLINEYEQAFESWLIDSRIQYVTVDQQKRRIFARNRIKSFDFLLYPAGYAPVIIAEVKGRKFKGTSLKNLTGLQCWVTMEDVQGLIRWEQVFGGEKPGHVTDAGYEAWFVFAYEFENVDVETDGRGVYDYRNRRYIFFAVRLDDYREFMTMRSPKWRTVTLPAAKFRECAVPVSQLLFQESSAKV